MFTRLLKHQLKSTWKEFAIAYGAIIALAFILALAIVIENPTLLTIAIILFVGTVLALSGLLIYFVFRLFYTTTYGRQGYLTFTLPISTHALLISKIVSALIYSIGYVVSLVLAVVIFSLIVEPTILENIFPVVDDLISLLDINWWVIVVYAIYGIVSMIAAFVVYQFVFALANTTAASKKKAWIIILLLWAVTTTFSIIAAFDPFNLFVCLDNETGKIIVLHYTAYLDRYKEVSQIMSIWQFVLELAKMIGLYFLTVHIINKKIEIQ